MKSVQIKAEHDQLLEPEYINRQDAKLAKSADAE